MEDKKLSQNILPSNYVTLVQLQERWKKQQQDRNDDHHQQQQEEKLKEQDNNHPSNNVTLAQQWKQNKHQKEQRQYDDDKKHKQKQQQEEEAQQIDGKDKQINRGNYVRNRRLKSRNFTGSSSGASPSEKQNQNGNDAVQVASAVEGNDAACVPAFVAVEENEDEIKKKKKKNKKRKIKRKKEKEWIKDGETAITQGEEAEKAPVREKHPPLIKSQKGNIIPPMRYERRRNTGMVKCVYRAKNAVETVRKEGVEIVDMKIGELSVEEEHHEISEKQNGVVAADDNGSNYSNSNSSVYSRSVYNRRNSQYGGYNGRNSQYGGRNGRNFAYRGYEYDCGIRGRNLRFAQRNGSMGMVWAKKGEAAADGEGTGDQSSSCSVKE